MSPHLLSGAARLAGSSLLRLQTDERLVALVRDGHDPAFSAVVDRYQTELVRYCTRLVGESRAEDVVQQAFLNAHMALHANDNPIQLRPWLYRIAHNAGLNVLRSSRQQAELDERLAAPGGLEHDVESRERLHEALAAIAMLPEPQRDALTLRAIEGRSHVEIAAALGVSAGAARQHLHRARTSVRAAVSAITPYGLIARLAMAGTDGSVAPIAASASAGVGVTVAKVSAGLLAAGALGVGATNLPVLHPSRHHGDPKVSHAAPRAALAAAGATAPGAAAATSSTAAQSTRASGLLGRGHGPHGGRGRDGTTLGGFGHDSGSGNLPLAPSRSGDSHSGDSHSGDSHSGSGDSGSSGSGSGDGGHQSSGDSHSGDSSGSGSSSGDTSGSGSGSGSDGGTSTDTTSSSGDTSGSGDTGSTSGDSGSGSGDTTTTPTTTTSGGDSQSTSGTGDLATSTDGSGSGGTSPSTDG